PERSRRRASLQHQDLLDDFLVRRGPRQPPQLARIDPAQPAGARRPRRAAQIVAVERVDGDTEMGITVLDDDELVAHAHADAQFLFDLALAGLRERFAALDLAAREFPQAAEQSFGFAL